MYLQVFVNFKQNNLARLLAIAKVAYNNNKNANTGHMLLKLNCGYYPCISFEEETNLCYRSKSANKLLVESQDLITICQENFYHAHKVQKQVYDKGVKPKSYAPSNKVWLNSKYIKTKRNQNIKAKYFRPFRVLHLIDKQAYKLKLPKKWRIYNVFMCYCWKKTSQGRSV